jgi:formate dehydrogenase maturation protein FdhE
MSGLGLSFGAFLLLLGCWLALSVLFLSLWVLAGRLARSAAKRRERRQRHFFPVCDPDPVRGFVAWLEEWDGKLPEWLSSPPR